MLHPRSVLIGEAISERRFYRGIIYRHRNPSERFTVSSRSGG